jgi:hypothetical protein
MDESLPKKAASGRETATISMLGPLARSLLKGAAMKRPLPSLGVASLVGLLAGCSPANDSRTSGDPGPISNDPAPESSAPAPAPSSSTEGAPPAAATAAPPLSERAAKALSVDAMQRFNDAIEARYPGPPHETVDDTFIVISGEPSAPFEQAVKATREMVDALWHGPYFVHRPEKSVIAWIASTPATLHALVREHAPFTRDTGLGMYDVRSRQIFVATGPAGWGSWNHEIAHPLIRADFPRAPAWVSEGLAALFEVSELRADGTFGFGAHFRLQTIRTALTKPEWADQVKLDTVFTWTTDDAFRKNEALHYGCAREALRWLHSQGLFWPFYRAWREGVTEDPTGEKAFEAVVHQTPAQASEAWRTWLNSSDAEGVVPQVPHGVAP